MLIINQKDKELEKIIRAYNQSTDIINEKDIAILINSVNTISIPHKKTVSNCLLIKYFGYYFSDAQYAKAIDELIKFIDNWINDDERISLISNYIFDVLKENRYRIDNNLILSMVFAIHAKKLKRWYDNTLKLIYLIDFEKVSENNEKSVLNLLITLISDKISQDNCHHLAETIIYVRKNMSIDLTPLDKCILEKMPLFYKTDYSLEVFNHNKTTTLNHIKRFIDTIHNQNEKQGQNNTYYGYGGDIYTTIRNIVVFDNLVLDWNDLNLIISATEETLLAPKQLIIAKNNAIRLIMYLKNKFPSKSEWEPLIEKWCAKQENIICGKEDGIFGKDSITTLKFNFMLLKICFGRSSFDEVLTEFASTSQMTDYELIITLKCIKSLLIEFKFDNLDSKILTIIMQYVAMMSSHKEMEVRFLSAENLILLTHSSFKHIPLKLLSKMMDLGTYEIKTAILNRVKKIPDDNLKIINYIKQKGLVDNHYLVRRAALKEIE
jgi:hypothetical protein